MTDETLLVGDIGGTNARFALACREQPFYRDAVTLQCADFPSADDAIKHYLNEQQAGTPDAICLAAAGPVVDGTVQMTNNHWVVSRSVIAEDFGITTVEVLNDFAAAALSVPHLESGDVESIGLPEHAALPEKDFTVAVIGAGTGLGAAGLVRRGGNLFPIVGEGGHVGFAPKTQVQMEMLTVLRRRFDRVSAERVISGSGLENIYWALTQIHGEQRSQLSAREIFEKGRDDSDIRAVEATHLFFELLGQAAGDLALTLGAQNGVYLAGGIAKRYPGMLQNSGFRTAFEDKGRHRAYMERIPTVLITHDEPGLLGAARRALVLFDD